MLIAWPCWRLWNDDKATMTELETTLSITDVERACSVLDAVADLQREYREARGVK